MCLSEFSLKYIFTIYQDQPAFFHSAIYGEKTFSSSTATSVLKRKTLRNFSESKEGQVVTHTNSPYQLKTVLVSILALWLQGNKHYKDIQMFLEGHIIRAPINQKNLLYFSLDKMLKKTGDLFILPLFAFILCGFPKNVWRHTIFYFIVSRGNKIWPESGSRSRALYLRCLFSMQCFMHACQKLGFPAFPLVVSLP